MCKPGIIYMKIFSGSLRHRVDGIWPTCGSPCLVSQCLKILSIKPFSVNTLHPVRQCCLPPVCFKQIFPGLYSFSFCGRSAGRNVARCRVNPQAGLGISRCPVSEGPPAVGGELQRESWACSHACPGAVPAHTCACPLVGFLPHNCFLRAMSCF